MFRLIFRTWQCNTVRTSTGDTMGYRGSSSAIIFRNLPKKKGGLLMGGGGG